MTVAERIRQEAALRVDPSEIPAPDVVICDDCGKGLSKDSMTVRYLDKCSLTWYGTCKSCSAELRRKKLAGHKCQRREINVFGICMTCGEVHPGGLIEKYYPEVFARG